ncbi:hypothetical protein DL771_004852 [Monosporascus sp. 5C6A]|nr:hypothetical protein DL771_004852 [Monosporascus sp. 5C6A]
MAVSQTGHLLKWKISDGSLLEDNSFAYRSYDVDIESNGRSSKAPALASISPDLEMLALGYRGGTVCLWELQSGELAGWARDEEDKLASTLLFNPNPNINLLLIIYTNHDLSLILSFTSDGSSIVDISDTCMRIWSPASLVRKNIEEDNSVSDDAFQLAVTEGQYETLRYSRITALCAHSSLPIVFAGKFNGEVIAFGTRAGQQKYTLYTHPHSASITVLSANNAHANVIASGDVHGVVQIWSLKVGPSSVRRNVSTESMQSDDDAALARWTLSLVKEEFGAGSIHLFSVREFPSKIDDSQVHLQYQLGEGSEEAGLDSGAIYDETLVLDVRVHSGYVSSSMMFLFDLSGNSADKEKTMLKPLSDLLPNLSKRFIGFSERTKTILFLHKDSWLSSINSKNLALNRYTQHFFIPTEYVSTSNHVLPASTVDDSIVFCLHGELVVVKKGLNFQELKSYS